MHVIDRTCNFESDIYAMTLWTSVVQLLLILPFLGLVDLLPVGPALLLFGLASLSAFGRMKWYQALSTAEGNISRLMPITRLSSLLVLVAAVVILGEELPPLAAFGAIAMILGAISMTLEVSSSTFRLFLSNNLVLFLVLVVAISKGLNSLGYKWILLDESITFFNVYFHLKLFECVVTFLAVSKSKLSPVSLATLSNPQSFVAARGLQTISGLIFLFVLNAIDLSKVEAISAIGPLIAVIWEWADRRFLIAYRMGGSLPRENAQDGRIGYRVTGIILIVSGFAFLQWGKP